MEMLNRAIEDASDFRGIMRKLEAGEETKLQALRQAMTERNPNQVRPIEAENRTQRRARERAELKAAKKARAL